jgi:hypothetical protein
MKNCKTLRPKLREGENGEEDENGKEGEKEESESPGK